jgi:gamma-glutamylputrescine oxidase
LTRTPIKDEIAVEAFTRSEGRGSAVQARSSTPIEDLMSAESASMRGQHPASYWVETGHPAPRLPALDGDLQADVAVIGGGFTGLSAAYHLAQAGVQPVVIEAEDIGWGASGRNGGMLPPRYKKGFAAIAKAYGNDATRRLHAIIHEALDTVEAIVADCAIDCGFKRTGQITAAHSGAHLEALEADRAWMEREAGDDTARILSRSEMIDEVGADIHVGGWLDPRGAAIHPLNYVRGLATALQGRGVPIFVGSPVRRLTEEPEGVRLELAEGTVSAPQAVIATNAYTDATGFAPGGLQRRIVPVTTSVICTKPLGANLAATVLPGRRMVADTKHIMNWYRMMPDNRVIFGGRGDITGRSDDPGVYAKLERQLAGTFPALADIGIGHRWSGKIAVTLDDFPHIGRLSPRVAYAMGYGGRGVALSNLLGKYLARLVQGQALEAGPMSANPFNPIPFHALRVPGMQIVAAWYQYLDAKAMRSQGRAA